MTENNWVTDYQCARNEAEAVVGTIQNRITPENAYYKPKHRPKLRRIQELLTDIESGEVRDIEEIRHHIDEIEALTEELKYKHFFTYRIKKKLISKLKELIHSY